MLIRFNNDNIWEMVEDGNGMVTFFHRVLTPKALRTATFDEIIDEDQEFKSNDPTFFNYTDWKMFFGEEKLKKLAVDAERERYILPLLYYATFLRGLTDMVRERETKFTFRKRTP